MVRLYIEMLAAFGAPHSEVTADAPAGLAFGGADHPTFIVVLTVRFHPGGTVVATMSVGPGQAVTGR
jgi:hypothetical protein